MSPGEALALGLFVGGTVAFFAWVVILTLRK